MLQKVIRVRSGITCCSLLS